MHDDGQGALRECPVLPVRGDADADQHGPVPGDVLQPVRPIDLVAAGWAQFLGRTPWQLFGTHTFRIHHAGRSGGVHPEKASKALRFFVSSINRDLYGRDWGRRWHGGLQWAVGQEFHKDGRLHLHSVIAAPTGDLYRLVRFSEWHRFWRKEFGNNRLERPRSQEHVSHYIAKYVSKAGEVDFSKNFGAWLPPPISYVQEPGQPSLIHDDQQHLDDLRTVGEPRVGSSK